MGDGEREERCASETCRYSMDAIDGQMTWGDIKKGFMNVTESYMSHNVSPCVNALPDQDNRLIGLSALRNCNIKNTQGIEPYHSCII